MVIKDNEELLLKI